MSIEKKIGKITAVRLGTGGYQDAAFGLSLTFESKKGSWGTGTFISGGWYPGIIDADNRSQWTENDREKSMAKLSYEIARILREAQVTELSQLKDIPVVITFEDMRLKEWRILTEVL